MTKILSGTQRVAIYELAKELEVSQQEVVAKARSLGIDAKNHMSRLSQEDVIRVQRLFEKERHDSAVTEKISGAVIRRRSKEVTSPVVEHPVAQAVPPRVFVRKRVVDAPSPSPMVDKVSQDDSPMESAVKDAQQFGGDTHSLSSSKETDDPLNDSLHSDEALHVHRESEQSASFQQEPVLDVSGHVRADAMDSSSIRESLADVDGKPAEDTSSNTPPHAPSASQDGGQPTVSSTVPLARPLPTRRSSEGLGPTGRVINLASLRPSPGPSSQERVKTSGVARGPRQEVVIDRARPTERERDRDRDREQSVRFQGKGHPAPSKKALSTTITTAAEHKRVVRMGDAIVIKDLANQMGLKATEVLKEVWKLGNRSVMINSPIDLDTAQLVAGEFDWRVESNTFKETSVVETTVDAAEDLKVRAPVITIMGHVDHGKTSLLDAIRNANVAGGEAGGITQHIGAYKVKGPAGEVVFLDTPGHEAFTEMRARGAQATDIVVLVVAADDGVMPQTLEALHHAKDAKVPIVVAVNKIDKPDAQPDRIRQQLAGHDLTPEEWGGQTIYVDVSARSRTGIDKLLEMLALQAEVLELRANPNKLAKGIVVEARMDAKRGAVVSVLVQEGTLRQGDTVVVGEELGKVRAMNDDKGKLLSQAGPSTPVELLGLSGVPRAGDVVNAVSDERAAKELVEHRRQRRVDKERSQTGPVSLDRLIDAMKAGLKELKIILKADVQGSVEALAHALNRLSTPQVKISIIQSGVGGITETDVNLAKAGNAVIIGFHVRPAGKAAALAEQEGVDIKLYNIIYEAIEDIEKARAGLLAPIKREKSLGRAEVRQVFHMGKVGTIAGSFVVDGLLRRNAQLRLVRDAVQIFQGKFASLRRFKDDVREVQQGYECGLSIEGFNDIKVGDVVECFEVEEVAATLG